MRVLTLEGDWNLVSWTGPAADVEAALAPLADVLISAHSYDEASDEFANYRPAGSCGQPQIRLCRIRWRAYNSWGSSDRLLVRWQT